MRVNTQRIQLERIKRGWSRSDLARRTGKSVSAISRIESGKYASPKTIRDIAELFNLEIEKLIILPNVPDITGIAV